VIDDALGDEVRITVIAAGFDRFEGERRETSLGLRDEERALGGGGDDDEAELGDDDFDVPDFLR
jgi:cell division protein FtsZ